MNRRMLCLGLISMLSFYSVVAQVNLSAGINFGGQISNLRGVKIEADTGFELVPLIGVNLELSLNESVSVVSGINFERWKKKRDVGFGGVPRIVKDGYDFFNVPLLFRYKFGRNKDFFVEGGAFMNYFNKGRPSEIRSLFIQFEDFNFGTAFGVGKIFSVTDRIGVAVQLRDELGLSDVNKYQWEISGDVMTNTIRLIATLSYRL